MITITHQDLLRLVQIIREETGMDVQANHHSMISARIRNHLIRLKLDSMESYWDYFSQNEFSERISIKSLMTTHYTFFFREYIHFEMIEKWIQQEIDRLKERFVKFNRPIRVWSAACSKGQEVYSLAQFLEVNLVQKWGIDFEVVGTDIDPDSVAYGENGVYPLQEVLTIPQMYLNQFWRKGKGPIKDFAAITSKLKEKIRWSTLNLFKIPPPQKDQLFDIVLCRNVFIYFSLDNVQKVAIDLMDHVEGNGLLISGLSEPIRFENWKWLSLGSSVYQKTTESVNHNSKLDISSKRPPEQNEVHLSLINNLTKSNLNTDSRKYSVLCVDDSNVILNLLKHIYSTDPDCQRVNFAENGKEAREKLDQNQYDLITLDIHMPVVDGIQFLEKHYNKLKDPPVIMLSSVNRSDVDLATKAINLGAYDYIEKPAMNQLQKSIDEIITKSKMALRLKKINETAAESQFDINLGKKLVIPDASQCLRLVLSDTNSLDLLSQIVCGQEGEYRSPSLLIAIDKIDDGVEKKLLQWTQRSLSTLRKDQKTHFKPNSIYLVNLSYLGFLLSEKKFKYVSTQVLSQHVRFNCDLINSLQNQIILDESLVSQRDQIETQIQKRFTEIAPATSFPSISYEFFSGVRERAA